eukprot:400402-Rhodomonas_salina.1
MYWHAPAAPGKKGARPQRSQSYLLADIAAPQHFRCDFCTERAFDVPRAADYARACSQRTTGSATRVSLSHSLPACVCVCVCVCLSLSLFLSVSVAVAVSVSELCLSLCLSVCFALTPTHVCTARQRRGLSAPRATSRCRSYAYAATITC